MTVNNRAPSGSTVFIKFDLSDSTGDYNYKDYDYIKLEIAPGFLTLDTNNVRVSIYDKGCIGHFLNLNPDGTLKLSDGDGFGWKQAPSSVPPSNRDLLWTG